MRVTALRIAAVASAVLLAGCGSSGGSPTAPGSSSRPAQSVSVSPSAQSSSSVSTSASSSAPTRGTDGSSTTRTWVPSHVVVVVEENHSYSDILGASAPYLHYLIAHGASLGQQYAVTHPSEPNYLALFSGSTQGLTDDTCPHRYGATNLAAQLRGAGRQLVGYAEGLPSTGSAVCNSGEYARRHAPWTDFTDLPASTGRPMTSFPTNYATLPSVSFVVPNLLHDMHDGTIAQADTWLHAKLGGYANWALTHNSLLIVTWDEDDHSQSNRIPTVFFGAHVRHVLYTGHSDHYRLLRTVEWLYGLPGIGTARYRTPLTGVFTS